MSNEAPAASKNFLRSKTLWVNAIALASLFSPAVRDWAAAEPEAPVIILAFVNLVLRTVTRGPVKFSTDEVSGNGGASGASSGWGMLPLALALICLLPSCTSTGYPLDASVFYKTDGGAKVGVVYRAK